MVVLEVDTGTVVASAPVLSDREFCGVNKEDRVSDLKNKLISISFNI